jgi:hypothetical protein
VYLARMARIGTVRSVRVVERLIVIGLLTVSALAVSLPVAPTADAATSTDLLVGDSVMAGMGTGARSVLGNHVFDAKVCRRLVSTGCSYQGVRPVPALSVVGSWAGTINRAIVVAAGYNDDSIGGAVDAVVAEARRQGVPHVVWLTYRVAGNDAGTYRDHNTVLWQKAAAYPELRIADWASLSAGRSSWVADDGLHLTSSGAQAMASLIATTLLPLPPPGPPPLDPGEDACFVTGAPTGSGVIVNLTPVLAASVGHGALTSGDQSGDQSGDVEASNVNFGPGTVDPNVAVAPTGTDGRVCYRNSPFAKVHLVADQLGTVAATAYTPARPDGTPDRRIDTRPSGTPLAAGGRRCFAVAGLPGDGAVVNLTPVDPSAPGHGVLTSSDAGGHAGASNVNYRPGLVDPNVAIAPIGDDGEVCFHASDGASVHLVADHLGTISASAYAAARADGSPDRRVDTRPTGEPVAPGGTRCFTVAGEPGDAAVVNLTPVLASGSGDGLLVASEVAERPDVSNVNYGPGTVDPNVAVARIGPDGAVCFRASPQASVHLVADLLGTIDGDAFWWPNDAGTPARRLDTRVD